MALERGPSLLDFSQPLDVSLLDAVVSIFHGAASPDERVAAENILKQLHVHPDAWTRVDSIMEQSLSPSTKFFALQVLEDVIKHRWNALPAEQREGIKNFLTAAIVRLSADSSVYTRERAYVNKLNLILVQVVKHEWPARWPAFLPDMVGAAKTSEALCENCMVILKLLSEEVFDFSRGELTQARARELKAALNAELGRVFELCEFVMAHSQRVSLVHATLAAIHAFLSWAPLGYIFESPILDTLLRYFQLAPFRNIALQCLTEVAALQLEPAYDSHFLKLYAVTVTQLQLVLPLSKSLAEVYAGCSSDEQAFLQNLALFFTSFFKAHLSLLERTSEHRQALLTGLEYLLAISYIDDQEVFKVCIDYWATCVCDLFHSDYAAVSPGLGGGIGSGLVANGGGGMMLGGGGFGSPGTGPLGSGGMLVGSNGGMVGLSLGMGGADGGGNELGAAAVAEARRLLYGGFLSSLRLLMINRMAKPEEVIVVEDENGNVVRETMKDNDVLVLYKTMRETLIYLSHLDRDDTERLMLDKLALQLNGREYSWGRLNTLCWAIGSVSGSMPEEQENRFLVTAIRDLLSLCEITRGKDHKAIIASNIMYVVGQYPRFLRAHWKFLKTVVNKLFEFMHEAHPGVQDMACDTFVKIAQKCRRKFVVTQVGEAEPFVAELLTGLTATICDLEAHQICVFYEAVGHMIQSEASPSQRDSYVARLMEPPNMMWNQILAAARAQGPATLRDPATIRQLLNILHTNNAVCGALGQAFLRQINGIYMDMLEMYRLYSEFIAQAVSEGGPHASRSSGVKAMRSVKREVLRLIEAFVERCDDTALVAQQLVPAMMVPVLGDYARSVPDARDPEVLSLMAAMVNKLQGALLEAVPQVLEAVFEPTLSMITVNFEDFPEHRLQFFALLRAAATHCYPALAAMPPARLKLLLDSIVWAMRHTERNVADMGLNLLLVLLKALEGSTEAATAFYGAFYTTLVQEVFAVMTDTFHKPGFKLHAQLLQTLLSVLDTALIAVPLWDAATLGPSAYPSNAAFARDYICKLLGACFPNMLPVQVSAYVTGMVELKADFAAFKAHLRDFLVQTREFASQDNAALYEEEVQAKIAAERAKLAATVPGMLAPSARQDDMDD